MCGHHGVRPGQHLHYNGIIAAMHPCGLANGLTVLHPCSLTDGRQPTLSMASSLPTTMTKHLPRTPHFLWRLILLLRPPAVAFGRGVR